MIETEEDTRAILLDAAGSTEAGVIGHGGKVRGVFDQLSDQALDFNGRRTGFRIYHADLAVFSISYGTDLIFNLNTDDEIIYTVRAIERGARTAVLHLEQKASA